MNAELSDRRNDAMTELLEAAKEIADDYGLCPICLVMAVNGIVHAAVAAGDLEHFTDRHAGDESRKGFSLQ
jgi:hypothetical protein